MRYVIDTNIPVTANGQNSNAKPECRLCTIDFLEAMIARGRLILDVAGAVQQEYQTNLTVGQPGVGNRFLQAFLTAASKRIERVNIRKQSDGEYVDFPATASLKKFDRSDRKFAALSKKAGAPVANAVDSDWLIFRADLEKEGVKVEFICGCDRKRWFVNHS